MVEAIHLTKCDEFNPQQLHICFTENKMIIGAKNGNTKSWCCNCKQMFGFYYSIDAL